MEKCFLCGDMTAFEIELKGTENVICDDCRLLSACCGSEFVNGFCSQCKEHA